MTPLMHVEAEPLETFRDPAGILVVKADAAYRRVASSHAGAVLEFLAEPLAARLVDDGRLIGTEILHPAAVAEDDDLLVLRHPLIGFPSYPAEWPPALWFAAAEATLTLCEDLLASGYLLKDATPLNILFDGVRPVLVDLLSVERMDGESSLWLPYAQFTRTFLLPMIAYRELGWPLGAAMLQRDGYEPEDLFRSLSLPGKMRRAVWSSVTLPVVLGKVTSAGAQKNLTAARRVDPEMNAHVLRRTFRSLRGKMRLAMPRPASSTWSGYAEAAHHYTQAEHAEKLAFVRGVLQRAQPHWVLDVGANTGVYSFLAAEVCPEAHIVALDQDMEALDRLAVRAREESRRILPLHVDLAHPTPATGWRNAETRSFLQRAERRFDLVMMLAVIHHLLLRSQIPLTAIAELVAAMTTRDLILEWVPATDLKFKELVRGREALYQGLTEEAMRSAFAPYFIAVDEKRLSNGRLLLHLRRR